MAEEGLSKGNISNETQQILELINEKNNFLLSGGAGSGKTYTLVETINEVSKKYPALDIACITYTNAAVDEIESRTSNEKLHVSTIHDFLWTNIKQFQTELKDTLIELINNPDVSRIKNPDEEIAGDVFFGEYSIRYKEYVRLKKGVISHDEVIILASTMYEKYEKLRSITIDKYPFVFVDEYQDTSPSVIQILLNQLDKSEKQNVIGFFGDAMQSIYGDSIGNLDDYIKVEPPRVIEVLKAQNRRNPLNVINLANQLRTDGLTQMPSEDSTAPNMDESDNVKSGEAKFFYSQNESLFPIRTYLGWNFSDSQQVKELNLTHNLIAKQAEFTELMRVYDGDKILEFVKKKVRKYLIDNYPALNTSEMTLGEVLERFPGIKPTPKQQEYIDSYPFEYSLAKAIPYNIISKLYVTKEQLLDDKKNYIGDENKPNSERDDLIKHLFKLEHCIRLYQDGLFNQFIKITNFSISTIEDKRRLNEAINGLLDAHEKTIGEIIDIAHDLGIVIKGDHLRRFSSDKSYVYKQVCNVSYQEFRNVYNYLEGYTPFSTQHKTKGTEFSNVLVVLDNGKWNQYNFKYLFEQSGNENVIERTNKIFYVCCTRAKEKLAVFFHSPSPAVLITARQWFGSENVINLDEES